MPALKQSFLSFTSSALSADAFGVSSFHGRNAISHPYEYEVLLYSDKDDINCQDVLLASATLKFIPGGLFPQPGELPERDIHGILASFEQLHKVDEKTFYRAVLVPHLWLLSQDEQNLVYLNMSIPEIIEKTLKNFGLNVGENVQLKLQSWKGGTGGDPVDANGFPKWEYLCQYHESSLSFIHRLMERDGLYYYFEQSDQGEKMVICNASMQQQSLNPEKISYTQTSSLDDGPALRQFLMRQQRLPKQAGLIDYNYLKPTMFVSGLSEIDQNGMGEQLIYAEHFKTAEEGAALAKIRAEEFAAQKLIYTGETTYTHLAPGYICEVQNHFRDGDQFNQKFQIITMEEEGEQPSYIASGMGMESRDQVTYNNHFTAIPSSVQFRAKRRTPRPRISGTIHGVIDLEGIDKKGRYKVRLPFAQGDGGQGKASTWVRLVKPYTGNSYGSHFPLHMGTEVMIAFTDGDPDRPYIAGAMENENTPSQTQDVNIGRHQFATGSYTTFSTKSLSGLQVSIPALTGGLLSQLGASGGQAQAGQGVTYSQKPALDTEAKFTQAHSAFGTTLNPTEILYATQERLYVHQESHTIHNLKPRIIQNEQGQTVQHTGNTYEYTKADNHTINDGKITTEHTGDHDHTQTGDLTSTTKGKHTLKQTGDVESTHTGKKTTSHTGDYSMKRVGKTEEVREGSAKYTTTEDVEELIEADKKKTVHGTEKKLVMGNAVETVLGTETRTIVGQALATYVGMDTDVHVGIQNEIALAMANELKITAGFEYTPLETDVDDVHTQIKELNTQMEAVATCIGEMNTRISEVKTTIIEQTTVISSTQINILAVQIIM